jgi:hypothetical protein
MKSINEFFAKNKKLMIIVLVAAIIIASAWYFLLGDSEKEDYSTTSSSSGGSGSGSSAPRPTTTATTTASSFPIKWGVKNTNMATVQRRLNETIRAVKAAGKVISGYPSMELLTEDGILGSKSVAAIRASFPTIGQQVAISQTISQSQYTAIVNSKPNV